MNNPVSLIHSNSAQYIYIIIELIYIYSILCYVLLYIYIYILISLIVQQITIQSKYKFSTTIIILANNILHSMDRDIHIYYNYTEVSCPLLVVVLEVVIFTYSSHHCYWNIQ